MLSSGSQASTPGCCSVSSPRNLSYPLLSAHNPGPDMHTDAQGAAIDIFPKTWKEWPRSPYGPRDFSGPGREVAHPWHQMCRWDGTESEADYIARVAKGKRLSDFREKQAYSRHAMGTPCAWVYDPTDEDREFARDCWARVEAARPAPEPAAPKLAPKPAAHWLDVIRVFPLAKGVPVVDVEDQGQPRHIVLGVDADWLHLTGHDTPYQDRAFRVDLEDPQGFGWAIRWLYQRHPNPGQLSMVRARFYDGDTTDADRLALAQALAEVQA